LLVSIRDCRHSKKDRQWIQDVYPEYLDALADLNTGLFSVLGTSNPHQDEIFANWFANDHSHPLIISKGPEAVGFALVTRPRVAPPVKRRSLTICRNSSSANPIAARGSAGRRQADFRSLCGGLGDRGYQRNPASVTFWRRVLTHTARPLHRAHPEWRSAPALHQPTLPSPLNYMDLWRADGASNARRRGAKVSRGAADSK